PSTLKTRIHELVDLLVFCGPTGHSFAPWIVVPAGGLPKRWPYPAFVPDLRVAIIGYGLAGRFFHAPLIAGTNGLAVSAVVTANPERRAQVEHEHPDAQ